MHIYGDLVGIWETIKARGLKQTYVYLMSRDNGEPFYVGVGTGRRILLHERSPAIDKPNPKAAAIRAMLAEGKRPHYQIVAWFDVWALGAAEERRLIKLYGRADLGLGPLLNRTDGGQGVAGILWKASPNRIAGNLRAADKNRGRKHTPEHNAAIGAGNKGKKKSPEHIAKVKAALTGRVVPADQVAKMAAAAKGRKPSKAILDGGAKWRKEHAEEISAKRRALWRDEGYRLSQIAAMTGVKRSPEFSAGNRLRQKAKFEDPEFLAKWNAAREAGYHHEHVRALVLGGLERARKSRKRNP